MADKMSSIKSIIGSGIRTGALIGLRSKPQTAAELARALKATQSQLLHSIRPLVADSTIIRRGGEGRESTYALSTKGVILSELLSQIFSAEFAVSENESFLQSHDLSGIPSHLLARIGDLAGSCIIKSDNSNIFGMQDNYIKEIASAKKIYGIAPVMMPGDAETIIAAANRGTPVSLILTNEILSSAFSERGDILRGLLKLDNFHLYKIESAKVAFTVTDSMISLGLFLHNGDFDALTDLICRSHESVMWGTWLFRYYLESSTQI
jgi:predicted transcriptional regulator